MENFDEIYERYSCRYDLKYSANRYKFISEDEMTEEIKQDIIRLDKQKKDNMNYVYEIYCACYNYNQILCSYISGVNYDYHKIKLIKSKLEDRKKEIKDLLIKLFLNYDFEICKYNTSARLEAILNIFNEFLDFKKDGLEQFINKIELEETFIVIPNFFDKLFTM